jgi:hypothetical protein
MTRSLNDLEFLVMWEETGHDTLPLPLSFATDVRDRILFDQAKFEIRERLAAARDEYVDHVLQALAHPDIHIAVHAHDGADPFLSEGSIRIYAARRGDQGYVVRQLPGKTIWHSSGFIVTQCDAIELAAAVVRELPEQPAGRHSNISLDEDNSESEADPDAFAMYDFVEDDGDSTGHLADYLFTAPAQRVGQIDISQGSSRFGPRGITRRRLGWRDLLDDGRYTITGDPPAVAHGTDSARLINLINTEIAEIVRAIKDERND